MQNFFTFMETYRTGILLFVFILAALAALVQWFAWIFGLGRFGKDISSGSKALSVAFSEFLFKIINEFRHLLALLVFMVFTVALIYSLVKAASIPTFATNPADPTLTIPGTPSMIDNMKEALQAVVATLGGLIGSIIGYYFGESSAAKGSPPPAASAGAQPPPAIQTPPGDVPSAEPIKPIERPNASKENDS